MERTILEAFQRCQRRFPTVQLPLEAFQSRIRQILAAETKPPADEREVFARLHHEDLFLATACALDDRIAWEHFADDHLPLLRKFAEQACGSSGQSEDLSQEIIAKLLGDKKRLAAYNGRGSLDGWLRVAAAHAAVDRFRRTRKQVSLDGLEEDGNQAVLAGAEYSIQEEALDSNWGPIVTRITGECIRGLPARDRMLLSLYHLHGVPLKDLGRQFGISEATASRWLDGMRRDIRKRVEKELRKRHRIRSREIESLWKWISPSALAESIGANPGTGEKSQPKSAAGTARKSAMGENPSVIKKEGLR